MSSIGVTVESSRYVPREFILWRELLLNSLIVAQKMCSFSRKALWTETTFFMVLVLPLVFETEKLGMEQ